MNAAGQGYDMGMEQTPMNLSVDLPPDLAEFVREAMLQGEFETPAQMVEALLRRAKRTVDAQVHALLLEGIESGAAVEVTPGFWEERERILESGAGASH
jgi:antitoxin ParD1/3/4